MFMRYTVLFLFLTLYYIQPQAQVGINTTNPKGIFHINGNVNDITSSSFADDFIVSVDAGGEVITSIGSGLVTSAQMALGSTNKALHLNNVALTSPQDITTVPAPSKGLLVYNTTVNADLVEGVYFFNGQIWVRWEATRYVGTAIKINNLLEGKQITQSTNVSTGAGATLLKFTPTSSITIPEKGAFAFSLRLYGGESGANTPAQTTAYYYIYLIRKKDNKVMDSAELDIFIMKGRPISYTVALSGNFEKNDEVEIRLAGNRISTGHGGWTLGGTGNSTTAVNANRTSLVWWRL